MKKNNPVEEKLKILLYWFLFGTIAVFARRIKYYGFTRNIFMKDFKVDLIIGLSTALLFGIFFSLKKSKSK